MNIQFQQKLTIGVTIASSESIMFMKGGKQSIDLDEYLKMNCVGKNLSQFDEMILTFQIEPGQQHRTDFITSEAAKHRAQWDKINEEEAKQKKDENTQTD